MPARKCRGNSSYRHLAPVRLSLMSRRHSTAAPSPSRYGKRYEVEGRTNFLELRYGEVRRARLLRASVSKKLLAYSRAVDLRIRRAGRPPRLPLQARGLPPHTLRRIARLFAQDLREC